MAGCEDVCGGCLGGSWCGSGDVGELDGELEKGQTIATQQK